MLIADGSLLRMPSMSSRMRANVSVSEFLWVESSVAASPMTVIARGFRCMSANHFARPARQKHYFRNRSTNNAQHAEPMPMFSSLKL